MRILTIILTTALAVTSLQTASAETRAPAGAPAQILKKKAPDAPKPDYVILHASAIGGKTDEFMVQVKNNGVVDAPSALLQSLNMTPGNSGAATTPFPPVKAGQFVWVKVKLSKPVDRKARILVWADYNDAVAETKESNNKYGFNW